MAETAIALPLLLAAAVALVQFTLFAHAQNVVTAAVQDGARVAAAADRTLQDGVEHARSVLSAGLGRSAAEVSLEARVVSGSAGAGDVVRLEAQGRSPALIPWVADAVLPLHARAEVSKEYFRSAAELAAR